MHALNNTMEYVYQDDVLPIFLKFNTTPIQPREEYEKKIVHVKKPNYLNGSKKKELAERYLEYIENQTDKFLIEESNFNFSVIPVMYLDQPPSSMSEIDRNLRTVRKYMDDLSFTNKNNNNNNNETLIPIQHNTIIYKRLIERLIDAVYRMIEIFKKESLYILYHDLSLLEDQYNIDIYLQHPLIKVIDNNNNINNSTNNNNNNNNNKSTTSLISTMEINNTFNFNEFKTNCSKVLARLEKKQQNNNLDLQCYKEMIKDISHLYTMQHYDKVFYSIDHSTISPDDPAVGVTGLVVNRLHRLENELKTIQQHWNGTMLNSHNLIYKR